MVLYSIFVTLFALLHGASSADLHVDLQPAAGLRADLQLHPPVRTEQFSENAAAAVAATTFSGSPGLALFNDDHYAAQLHELISHIVVSNGPANAQHCKSLVYQTFSKLPVSHTATLDFLDLSFATSGRRGLTSGRALQLRCTGMTDSVLVSVLMHEIGHAVDIGHFHGDLASGLSGFKDFSRDVYENDLSLNFYRISWLSENAKRPESTMLDFVSGYAMTDPFEDFAEAYNWYVLQGANFRQLAQTNFALRQKYDFLKTYVFNNREFGGKMLYRDSYKRVYDSTLLPYSLLVFLKSDPGNSF